MFGELGGSVMGLPFFNLKHMKTVIFILLLGLFKPGDRCLEMDILLIGDMSGSVEGKEDFVIDAIEVFVESIETEENGIRIGVIAFNNVPSLVSPLYGNKQEIRDNVEQYGWFAHGSTNMSLAFQIAYNELSRDRQNVRKLIILISDGEATDKDDAENTVKELKMVNVGICCVLVRNDSSNPMFMKKISDGCYVESSYENLAYELLKMDICI